MRSAAFLLVAAGFLLAPCARAFQDAGAPPPPALSSLPKGGFQWTVGDYTLKLGGYVKVDLIHDFNQIGSTDSFDTRTIPLQSDPTLPDGGTRIHARQTRINLDAKGPVRVFVEGDFFGSGNAFRLRHAYGELPVAGGKILGGQTWTTFLDDAAMPETIDFESPLAFPQIRQAQVRYTRDLGSAASFAISLEDPDSDVLKPAGVTGSTEETIPDVNARVVWNGERAHLHLGLFGGWVRFDDPTNSAEETPLWGVNVSTKLATVGKDNLMAQVTYGEGVARYRGGNVAAIDAGGDLEAIPVVALMGAYQHWWCDQWRSNVVYGWANADPPSGLPATTTDRTDYLAINLIWQFDPRAWTGIEYLHGTIDSTGHDHGGAHRVQMAIRFDL